LGDIFANSTGAASASAKDNGNQTGTPPRRREVLRWENLKTVVWAPPVFVVGCPRSGTTLVQTILDSHPHLSVLYEADALIDIPLGLRSWRANAQEALRLVEAIPNFLEDGVDFRTSRAACRELGITDAAGAMRALAASQAVDQRKRRWGTKIPKALLHLTELAVVYPDAQFVHVIRDGRDSASSQARVLDRSIVQGALMWRTGMRTGRSAGSRLGHERYLEVRLEELLYSSEHQIRRICEFLGEGFDPSMLHFSTTARERIPASTLQFHPRLGEPPRPLPPNRDVAATGTAQRAAVALIEDELIGLGYLSAATSGRLRRIFYIIIGYILFLFSLRRNTPELLRHIARSGGARLAARQNSMPVRQRRPGLESYRRQRPK
jgi:hypothetical protein